MWIRAGIPWKERLFWKCGGCHFLLSIQKGIEQSRKRDCYKWEQGSGGSVWESVKWLAVGLRDGRDVGGGQFGKGLECQMEEFGFILQNKREVTCIGVLGLANVGKQEQRRDRSRELRLSCQELWLLDTQRWSTGSLPSRFQPSQRGSRVSTRWKVTLWKEGCRVPSWPVQGDQRSFMKEAVFGFHIEGEIRFWSMARKKGKKIFCK